MIGVVKAYTTRVGGGPFPDRARQRRSASTFATWGDEYGTVTGRPRRCGWFDAVAAGYGARISGVDCLAVMLLDVLSQIDEINVCAAYEIDGKRTTIFPATSKTWPVRCRCTGRFPAGSATSRESAA